MKLMIIFIENQPKNLHNECFVFFFFPFRYSSADAVGDLVAGITVGLTVIPQALAYAGIAGLDPAVSYLNSFTPFDLLLTDFSLYFNEILKFFFRSMVYTDRSWVVLCT